MRRAGILYKVSLHKVQITVTLTMIALGFGLATGLI